MSVLNISPDELDMNIPHKDWGWLSRQDILDWVIKFTCNPPDIALTITKDSYPSYIRTTVVSRIRQALYYSDLNQNEYLTRSSTLPGLKNMSIRTIMITNSTKYAEVIFDGVINNLPDSEINESLKNIEETIMHRKNHE